MARANRRKIRSLPSYQIAGVDSAAPQAEAHHLRGKLWCASFHTLRIVAIQNRPVGAVLILEQARLGAAVVVEIFVAIEMIVGEIEMHSRRAA